MKWKSNQTLIFWIDKKLEASIDFMHSDDYDSGFLWNVDKRLPY